LKRLPGRAHGTFVELREEGQDGGQAVVRILDRVGNKWTILAVGALADGPLRFSEIQRATAGISGRMLSTTLRGLQRDGLALRRVFSTSPPKVEYELTLLGRSLIEPLRNLVAWARSNRADIEEARCAFDTGQSRIGAAR